MKRETQRDVVLRLLRRRRWVSIITFVRAGVLRYGARIWELRKRYEIVAREKRVGHSRRVEYGLR